MALRDVKVRVNSFERGLLFRKGDYACVLGPGEHTVWSRLWDPKLNRVEVVSVLEPRFRHPLLDALLADPRLAAELKVLDLTQPQRALVWVDGRLHSVLGPGRHAFWNAPAKVEAEVFDVRSLRLEHPLLDQVLSHKHAALWLEQAVVPEECAVLLYRSGVLVDRLAPGQHALWNGAGKLGFRTVDLREKTADVAGQEIMTQDKVSLRVNLVVAYRFVDPARSVAASADADQALYREAQLALRAAVGGRSLDALLADKQSVGAEVARALAGRAAEFGAEVRSVGLRDVVLPGEMRTILNQVVEAERRAQAELIRRREETASVRSQANTARLLAENPVLARVRELELLKDVLAGTTATFVLGPGDLAGQVRSLVASQAGPG
jgi:regulator of protease activity HflC (stomatin/prohibitin superfamily)